MAFIFAFFMGKDIIISVEKVTTEAELEKVFAIRRKVFVDEQNCPPELEWEYEDESVHFLATVEGQPAGAARWRQTDKGFKLERFAVLKEFRGCGVGEVLVKKILADLPSGTAYIYLHAQLHAVGFYSGLGFAAEGSLFEEAGIQHYKMKYTHTGSRKEL